MKIYFDLDGVLTNFVKKCEEEKCFKEDNRPDWKKIKSLGTRFWTEMEWMPGAKELYEKVSSFAKDTGWKIEVLSAVYKVPPEGKEGKIEWCRKNLGLSKTKINIVPNREDKLSYANPESILIDDRVEIVNGFTYAGGTGILFKDVSSCSKKFSFLIEAMRGLKEDDLKNPLTVVKKRLEYLFRKVNLVYEEEYPAFRYDAYHEAESFISEFQEAYHTEEHEELKKKFKDVVDLYFEQEEYNDEQKNRQKKESELKESAGKSLVEFPSLKPMSLTLEENEWKKKMTATYVNSDCPPSVFPGKYFFSNTIRHIKQNQELSSFFSLHEFEQTAILMFVYLNLLADLIQNELAE